MKGVTVSDCVCIKEKVGGLSFDECLISRANEEVSTKHISSKSNRLLLIVNERKWCVMSVDILSKNVIYS